MRGPTFVGLDLETNGTITWKAAPIQIGVYAPDADIFINELIGWQGLNWSEKAEAIHGISQDELAEFGKPPETVHHRLTQRLPR